MFPKFPIIRNNDSDKIKYYKIKKFMDSVIEMFETDINIYYKVYYLIQVFIYVIDYSDIILYDIDTRLKNEELIKVLKYVCKTIHNNPLEQLVEGHRIELFDICAKVKNLLEDI